LLSRFHQAGDAFSKELLAIFPCYSVSTLVCIILAGRKAVEDGLQRCLAHAVLSNSHSRPAQLRTASMLSRVDHSNIDDTSGISPRHTQLSIWQEFVVEHMHAGCLKSLWAYRCASRASNTWANERPPSRGSWMEGESTSEKGARNSLQRSCVNRDRWQAAFSTTVSENFPVRSIRSPRGKAQSLCKQFKHKGLTSRHSGSSTLPPPQLIETSDRVLAASCAILGLGNWLIIILLLMCDKPSRARRKSGTCSLTPVLPLPRWLWREG
jgi:hypothetical protein